MNEKWCVALLLGIFAMRAWSIDSVHEIPVHEGMRVIVSGAAAQVSAIGSANSSDPSELQITMDPAAESRFTITESADQIVIKGKPDAIDKTRPKIEITGHSLPLEIHLLEGSINLHHWTKDALLQLQKGKTLARENSGSLAVNAQKGEITILDHSGKVYVDSFQAAVVVRSLSGDLDLQSFLGDVTIDKPKGALVCMANQGAVKITGGEGELLFDSQKSNWSIQNFQGRVEGQTGEGNVTVALAQDQDLNVKSQSGKVSVSVPGGSGALLNLTSSEGEIVVPSYLKVSRDGTVKSLRGRLKGDLQRASVLVRTQDGVIVIK